MVKIGGFLVWIEIDTHIIKGINLQMIIRIISSTFINYSNFSFQYFFFNFCFFSFLTRKIKLCYLFIDELMLRVKRKYRTSS